MTKFFIYFSILFNFYFANSQNNEESIILKNKVREQKVYDEKNELSEISKFDEFGKLIYNQKNNFSSSTYLKTSQTIKYDNNGKVLETIITHSSYPETTIMTNEYDEKNNLVKVYSESKKLLLKNYYDSKNQKIKEEMFGENDSINQITKYEYFDNDKKKVTKINGDFINDRTIIEYFDDQNRDIKSEAFNGNKIYFSTFNTYVKDKLIKIIYDNGEYKYGNNFFYDTKGRLVKRVSFNIENGKEITTGFEKCKYSKKDLIVKYSENIHSSGSKIRKYRYEYIY